MRTKPRWKTVVELCVGLAFVLVGGYVMSLGADQWSNQPTATLLVAVGFVVVWAWGFAIRRAWEEL